VAIIAVLGFASTLNVKRALSRSGRLEVAVLNERLTDMRRTLEHTLLPAAQFKKALRLERKAEKQEKKRKRSDTTQRRRRIFVLGFEGDLAATRVERLRQEITAVLTIAADGDEVLVRVESAGGLVHGYGLGASELERVKQRGVRLTVAVDKVAASGGYLMASVAHHIIAAPFALLGSIGVVAQVPNVHRLLKKHDVDFEILTAGQYKRTLTVFGENTDQGREKLREEIEDVHALFKEFVATNRPAVDVAAVATGEAWYGRRALDLRLVDELSTSDEYLVRACEDADVYEVKWNEPKRTVERLLGSLTHLLRGARGSYTGL